MTAYIRSSFVGNRRKTVPVSDARTVSDLGDARVGTLRGEDLLRRVEDPLEIAPRVGAELDHQPTATAGSVSMSCSIVATCRLRRSATKTIRLTVTKPAAPMNA